MDFYNLNWTAVVGIAGAISTLTGVLITNFYNSRNNDKKINFDLMDKDRERKFNLRKEIYLDAVDSIVEFEIILGSVSQAESLDSFNEFQKGLTKKLKKLELISDIEISIKVGELSLHFRNLINYIIINKLPLTKQQIHLSDLNAEFNEIIKDIKKLQIELSNASNSKEEISIENSLKRLFRIHSQLESNLTIQATSLYNKQKEFGEYILGEFEKLAYIIGTIYNGFRVDFGLDLYDKEKHDLSGYKAIKSKINDEYNKAINGKK
ncbi:hypothetical protein [Acinetobacter sp. XS-4]|uniref:hypothetical protein n=1 Tax=Acinetobacter sp. XS-4 TaxID=2923375 RepID=UPI00208E1B7C|nr:hypothetical protein [Acinetobacter sp. XS-4]USP42205.1 hypothetical protein MMY79_09145 [Acinetobacter sp. XS-4]